MKILILLSLMISATLSANDNENHEVLESQIGLYLEENSDKINQAEIEYTQWTKDLNKYMFEHSNPNVRVLGLKYLIKVVEALPEDYQSEVLKNKQEMDEMLNDFINDKDISAQSLLILEFICQRKKSPFKCDLDLLSQKRIDKEPENIDSYLGLLERANNASDEQEVLNILEMMVNAKYTKNHYYLIPELEQAIKDYEKLNPLPESYIRSSQEMYDELINLTDSRFEDLRDHLKDYMMVGIYIGYKLAVPMPKFRTLKVSCETYPSASDNCIQIAKTMQEKSYSVLGKVLGNAILLKQYELSGDKKALEELKHEDEKFRVGFECLSRALADKNSFEYIMSLKNYQIANKVERNKGEFASLMKQAELNYKDQLAKGNKQAVNPYTCFQ